MHLLRLPEHTPQATNDVADGVVNLVGGEINMAIVKADWLKLPLWDRRYAVPDAGIVLGFKLWVTHDEHRCPYGLAGLPDGIDAASQLDQSFDSLNVRVAHFNIAFTVLGDTRSEQKTQRRCTEETDLYRRQCNDRVQRAILYSQRQVLDFPSQQSHRVDHQNFRRLEALLSEQLLV
ncbi:hypothetical protein VDGD_20917 [Verticillium dahliae]|nr:hypothetical protein VDGD_20917 [Verticillium dahliae]